MSKVIITIETDNAAFEDSSSEIARILTKAAKRIREGIGDGFPLMDINGNKVGSVEVID